MIGRDAIGRQAIGRADTVIVVPPVEPPVEPPMVSASGWLRQYVRERNRREEEEVLLALLLMEAEL